MNRADHVVGRIIVDDVMYAIAIMFLIADGNGMEIGDLMKMEKSKEAVHDLIVGASALHCTPAYSSVEDFGNFILGNSNMAHDVTSWEKAWKYAEEHVNDIVKNVKKNSLNMLCNVVLNES